MVINGNFCFDDSPVQNGQKKFAVVLAEIHPDSCVVNGTGEMFNDNGITYIEKYCQEQLYTIEGQSITCEFLDNEKTEIYGHGETGIAEDNMPVFENAESIGHFTKAYIDNLIINGEEKRVIIGEGVMDEFRYKNTINMLKNELAKGNTVYGSVELYKKDDNESIIYEYGYKEKGRIPKEFIFSGYALLGIRPADKSAILLEINKKNGGQEMDEKALKEVIDSVIRPVLDKSSEYETKITELNSANEEANQKIETLTQEKETAETNASEAKKESESKDEEIKRLKEENENLQTQINECKKKEKNSEMNQMLSKYTDSQKKCVESEINAFKEDPLNTDIDAIEATICKNIVNEQILKRKNNELNTYFLSDEETHDSHDDNEIDIFE